MSMLLRAIKLGTNIFELRGTYSTTLLMVSMLPSIASSLP